MNLSLISHKKLFPKEQNLLQAITSKAVIVNQSELTGNNC